jgi:DNA-binding LytR/AlgR family response regulator
MEIRCIIVDDEELARQLLEGYVNKIPYLKLVRTCKNSLEAMDCLQGEPVDLMFLDIQMPELTGIEFLQTLHKKPVVIFTTAYKEYALEGYELDVIDYMLKPISFERFLQGVNKAAEHIKMKIAAEAQTQSSPISAKGNEKGDHIILKADHKFHKIFLDDILYIEGLKEYVTFYTTGRKIIVLESLKKLETDLPSDKFMRIHKSYIINTDKVKTLYGNQVLIGETYVPIGKSYAEEAKKRLFGIKDR